MAAPLPKHVAGYYDSLQTFDRQGAASEGAVRIAFQNLLTDAGRQYGLTVLAEQAISLPGKRTIRVDGDLRDSYRVRRGIWEAKDTADDLETEIRRKIEAGYPTKNTVFENTVRGVLYQDGVRVLETDLQQPHELQLLLDRFLGYAEPQIHEFHLAVKEFRAQLPELAARLGSIIDRELAANRAFRTALGEFHDLCRESLNPETTLAEVEDMLKQHLLTERIFRSVFRNAAFVLRNPIARELEKVVGALTSRAFSREEFFGKLDYFYRAIEGAAKTIASYEEKQDFLHAVYEQFFQGYSTDTADTHGIVYTPRPIVKWMVASVDEALKREFGRSLGDRGVHILDPCVGTGTFVLELMEHIGPSALPHKYAQELHANEVLLLPYYIAAQNIEHEYFERTGEYRPFEGLCFADTLDLGRTQIGMFTPENTERIQRQEAAPIQVILGNPPYNVGQQNENDNNKNRRYFSKKGATADGVDDRIRATYVKESRATLNAQLYDMYVRFFRWASDRLGTRDGVVCFVSNNSFLDQIAFDGMRKELRRDFTHIYVLDLGGNVRKNPKLSGTTHNVFGIQVGVSITLLVRKREGEAQPGPGRVFHASVDEFWKRRQKYEFLDSTADFRGIEWNELTPDARENWLTEGMEEEFDGFPSIGGKAAKSSNARASKTIFSTYCGGVKTNRDDWVYGFDRDQLSDRARGLSETYNSEVDRWKRDHQRSSVGDFLLNDDTRIKWSGDLKDNLVRGARAVFSEDRIRQSLYRPFVRKFLYFDSILNNRRYLQQYFFPQDRENVGIVVSDLGHRSAFSALVTSIVPDIHLLAASDVFQTFPYYVYDEDGTNRRENITDWALAEHQARYGSEVTKWDIFHYVYGILHSPEYRTRYAENLKRELPRIPYVAPEAFRSFAEAGRRLAELHVGHESAAEYPLRQVERDPFTWRVERMRLSADRGRLVVNESLTLEGIPEEAHEYRLGNRSALEWVVDQYRVKTDRRSGITHDPNDPDDPEHIVRLVKQVVTVSVETVAIVRSLPALEIEVDAAATVSPR